ncbi:MAG: hypothetical protein K9M36_03050 [Candidatus Pacebacteria bacterium]|nr:hypothetical protein [Candidatus Paceibacterota bacterium]
MKKAFFTHIMCLCAFVAYGQTKIGHDASFWMDVPFQKDEKIAPPILWYVLTSKYVTAEVRWNFETSKSISLYLGKTFSFSGKESEISITPAVGGILDPDGYQAWSPQLTLDIESERGINIFSFTQVVFSNSDRWVYQWTEFAFPLSRWINLEMGVGWQIIVPDEPSTSIGVFLRYTGETKKGGLYIQAWPQYDPLADRGSFMIGIGFLVE